MSKAKTTAKTALKPVTKVEAKTPTAAGRATGTKKSAGPKTSKKSVSRIEMEEALKSDLNITTKSSAPASGGKSGAATGKTAGEKAARTAPGKATVDGKLYGEIEIENSELERFENRTTVRRYTIEFTCPEFTCVCPRSGFPDFATIRIKYVPDRYCVELKSLKLYINGFRNMKVFHEDVTNNIIQDMIDLLDPHEIEVIGDFTVRGNIHTVVTATHSK